MSSKFIQVQTLRWTCPQRVLENQQSTDLRAKLLLKYCSNTVRGSLKQVISGTNYEYARTVAESHCSLVVVFTVIHSSNLSH